MRTYYPEAPVSITAGRPDESPIHCREQVPTVKNDAHVSSRGIARSSQWWVGRLVNRETQQLDYTLSRALHALSHLEVFDSHANFVLVRAPDGPQLAGGLRERGFIVRNLHRDGALRNCLRITVGTPAENDALLAALAAL